MFTELYIRSINQHTKNRPKNATLLSASIALNLKDFEAEGARGL